jgi:peptide/nickel transport system ATP-binding protein
MAPSALALPAGCSFRPRCPREDALCAEPPALTEIRPGGWARCFHPHGEAA